MKRILIIEDDQSFRRMLKSVLIEEGFEISEASNGNQGIAEYKENPCDLVITDLFMPEKDGLDTIHELKVCYPSLKIIAISGGGIRGDFRVGDALKMAKDLGVDAVLKKPFNTQQLVSRVREILLDRTYVLLVDDDPFALIQLENYLNAPHRRLIQASSGFEAIEKVHEYDFAVIVLDLNMPKMDGIETAKQIRKTSETDQIPIIFWTGDDAENIRTLEGYQSGAVDYLSKSSDPEIIKAKITIFEELYWQKKRLKQEIVEHQKTADTLNESKKMWETLVEHTPDIIARFDKNGRLLFVNSALEKEIGIPIDEVLYNDPSQIGILRDITENVIKGIHRWINSAQNPDHYFTYENQGSKHYYYSKIVPEYNTDGSVESILTIIRDITQQKLAELKLEEANTKMRDELEQAKITQLALLPQVFPQFEGIRFAAKYVPMDELAGDLYHVVALDEKRVGLFIADVMGHGVSSALLSSMIFGLFNTFAYDSESPDVTLRAMNDVLYDKVTTDKYATAFFGIFDCQSKSLTYSSAGHPPAYIIQSKNKIAIRLNHTGTLLGAFPTKNSKYIVNNVCLEKGDKLFLYTDGITEALGKNLEIFGNNRLIKLLTENYHLSIQNLLDLAHQTALEFGGGEQSMDDITLLGMELIK